MWGITNELAVDNRQPVCYDTNVYPCRLTGQ